LIHHHHPAVSPEMRTSYRCLSTSYTGHSIGENSPLVQSKPFWGQILTRLPHLPSFCLGRRRPQLFHLPPDLSVDVHGLPGDAPSDVPAVLSTISRLMDEVGVRWCIVGDLLLAHYCVPKITGVR
jgi:hypothetical protein